MLLVVFLLAVQLGPVAHLATHREGHTHGAGTAEHTAAHRAGIAHEHDTGPGDGDPPSSPDPSSQHGLWNSAHFGIALAGGQPPLTIAAPADTVAPAPVEHVRPPCTREETPTPVRGPPHSIALAA
jgi:hypothetical protein